jgi:hypothetical protein
MEASAPILKNKASSMGEDQRRKKPLTDRIKERLRDLVDDLVDSLEGLVLPQPEPIPVRSGRRHPRRH